MRERIALADAAGHCNHDIAHVVARISGFNTEVNAAINGGVNVKYDFTWYLRYYAGSVFEFQRALAFISNEIPSCRIMIRNTAQHQCAGDLTRR